MSIFNLFSKKETAPVDEQPTSGKLVKEDYKVAGIHYHLDNIKKLGTATPDWRKSGKTLAAEGKVMERIHHYTYINKPVKIIPDDGSIYEKGALMVFIAGEHVGYIPDSDTKHVTSILNTKSIKYISASIRGGEYKIVSENGEAIKWDAQPVITVRIAYS